MGFLEEYEAQQQGGTATAPQQPQQPSYIDEYETQRKQPRRSFLDEYEEYRRGPQYVAPASQAVQAVATPHPERTFVPADREPDFQSWLKRNQVQDLDHPDSHYDYRGAYMAGIEGRSANGHWPDTFKQHGHPTFSNESQYAHGDGGHWAGTDGNTYVPPTPRAAPKAPSAEQLQSGMQARIQNPGAIGRAAQGLGDALIKGSVQFPVDVVKATVGDQYRDLVRHEMNGQPLEESHPAASALEFGKGVVKSPIEGAKEIIQNPDPYKKGEGAAAVLGGLAMLYGAGRGGVEAYDRYQGRRARASSPGAADLAAAAEEQHAPAPEPERPPVQAPTTADAQASLRRAAERAQEADDIAGPSARAREAAPSGPVTLPGVYRGVPAGRSPEEAGIGGGRFFSPDERVAKTYAGEGGTVAREDLVFHRPLTADNWQVAKGQLGLPRSSSMDDLIRAAAEKGHDGIVFRSHNGRPEYVALPREQSETESTAAPPPAPEASPPSSPAPEEPAPEAPQPKLSDIARQDVVTAEDDHKLARSFVNNVSRSGPPDGWEMKMAGARYQELRRRGFSDDRIFELFGEAEQARGTSPSYIQQTLDYVKQAIERAGGGREQLPGPSVTVSTRPPRQPVEGPAGRDTHVLLPNGEKLPTRYRAVEASSLLSSHDPFTFQPEPDYPAGVQGRDYLRNKGAQETTRAQALEYNPDIALNPSTAIGEGQPTILPDGTVLAGNARSMQAKLAAELAPDRYRAYRRALTERAQHFGLDPEQVDQMERPVLVREITDPAIVKAGPAKWAEINRLSDQASTKPKSTVEEGAARAQALQGATEALYHFADTIAHDQTVAEYLGTAQGRRFAQLLVDHGVISKEELGRYTNGDGGLSLEGRNAVRDMLLSTAVTDPSVLVDAPPATVGKLEHAVPSIVGLRGTPWDPAKLVTRALKVIGEAKAKGLTLRDLEGQGDLLGRPTAPKLINDFASFLQQTSKSDITQAFRRYGVLAREAIDAGPNDMFGGTGFTPATAFRDAFHLEPGTEVFASEGIPIGPDLFGEERKAAGSEQSSLFGSKAGTTETRSTAQHLRALEAERQKLQQLVRGSLRDSPSVNARLAELDRVLNFGKKISPEEMATRARAGETHASEGIPQDRPQLSRAASHELGEPPAGEEEEGPQSSADLTPITAGPRRDALLKLLAPGEREGGGREAAGSIRHRAAELAHQMELAREYLRQFRGKVDRLTPEEAHQFIDDIEAGRRQSRAELQPVADAIRKALDQARSEIQALGTGKLSHFYADYFPHVWKDPGKAREVIGKIMARRPIEGPRSFLKKRSIVSVGEGLQHGLELVTDNPLDLVLLKLQEMRKYIMGQRVLADFKREGLATYVPALNGKAPEGYRRLDDHVAMVFGPPDVTVMESYDPKLKAGLEKTIRDLGGRHERSTTFPRRPVLGQAQGSNISTRFGTDITVLEHELGHLVDTKLGMWDRLVEPPGQEEHTVTRGKRKGQRIKRTAKQEKARVEERKTINKELRALADLRFEGHEDQVTDSYKDYVREAPEKIANAIHALVYLPERMEKVAPTVKAKLTEILKSDPRTKQLLELQKSLVAGTAEGKVPVGGLVVKGQYWAPEPVAAVLNNYLAPGLRGNPLYDAYMGVGNVLNQAQLGLSAFHLGFTSADASISKMALAIEQLASGRPIKALRSAAEIPVAPLTTIWRGNQLRKAYLRGSLNPEMNAIVESLIQGGGRVRMDRFYSNNAVASFIAALREGRPLGAAKQAIPAALETLAKPILEVVVPRQKLGVFADLARFELERMPKDATPVEVKRVMAKVWDSVDNRMGQLVYDNLFWSRTLKDLAMASTRSVGWNLGTLRELGGGAADLARGRLTHRAAYVVALPLTVGLAGAVMTYLYSADWRHPLTTGHGPKTLKDYFLPPTGRVNEDGNPERVQLPTYMKDVIAYRRHPVQTIGHKLHPLLATLTDMLSNEDYYGDLIRNPDDPLVMQLGQVGEYLAKQFIPFGVRNAMQEQEHGQSLATKIAPFVGVTPASRELVRSPAQQHMAEMLARRGHTARTPEEVEGSARRTSILQGLRQGTIGPRQLVDSLRAGALTNRQAQGMVHRQAEAPIVSRFKQLTWEEAEQVYLEGDERERQIWWPSLWAKRVRAWGQLEAAGVTDDRARMLEGLLRGKPGSPAPQHFREALR